jgi:hypothetical protein
VAAKRTAPLIFSETFKPAAYYFFPGCTLRNCFIDKGSDVEDKHVEREQRESTARRLETTFPSLGVMATAAA